MKLNLKKFFGLFNQKVLLCDLDGTLIETKSGKTFPENENDWQFKKYIKEAIQEYNPKYIFIISNQGGIENGYVDEKKFIQKMMAIRDAMEQWGDFIVDWTYCKSNDPSHPARKPNTGMIDFFKRSYCQGYDFGNHRALMIGDASGLSGQFSDSDLQCARKAGIKYTDVKYFIEAMVPCLGVCKEGNLPCGAGDQYPFLPCSEGKRARLKKVLIK